jgi:para-nitrobenzyl esterase
MPHRRSATGQDGTNLARLYDVVVVESNHRLGLLGYLFLGATARAERTLHLLGLARTDIPKLYDIPAARLLEIQTAEAANGVAPWGDPAPLPGFGAFVDGRIIPRHPFADGAPPWSAGKPLMAGTCRDETVFFSLFGPPDIFKIDEAGLRSRLSSTYQAAELDRIIATFRRSRPQATPAQVYFAITTSPIWRDAIKIAEAKAAQHRAPVFMYQLAYPDPTVVPGTDFPLGSPHASDIPMKFANVGADELPGKRATARQMSALWAATPRQRACRDGPPTRRRTGPPCGLTPTAGSSGTRTGRSGTSGSTAAEPRRSGVPCECTYRQ